MLFPTRQAIKSVLLIAQPNKPGDRNIYQELEHQDQKQWDRRVATLYHTQNVVIPIR